MHHLGSIGYVFLGVIAIWSLSWFLVPQLFGEIENPGIFGDMFGAVNALFSGLAFGGVIYAILLQKEELSLQRKELKLTREEMQRSTETKEHPHL